MASSKEELLPPPADTALGALVQNVTGPCEAAFSLEHNFGIMKAPEDVPGKRRKEARMERESVSFEKRIGSLSGLT